MKILHFKEHYEIKLRPGSSLFVNPIQRILTGLKKTTLRLKTKAMDNYRVRQGNYFKPCYDSDLHGWYLHIFKVERVEIGEMSLEQIQFDIGFKKEELDLVLNHYPEVNSFFLRELRKINHNSHIMFQDVLYLCHFEVCNVKNSNVTLDKFIKGEELAQTGEGAVTKRQDMENIRRMVR